MNKYIQEKPMGNDWVLSMDAQEDKPHPKNVDKMLTLTVVRSGNPAFKVEHFIQNAEVKKLKGGIITLRFTTNDKYAYVDHCSGVDSDGEAQYVSVSPVIFEKGMELIDEDVDAYYSHPSYFNIRLRVVVESDFYYVSVAPEKHAYTIMFIPLSLVGRKENVDWRVTMRYKEE